MAWEAVLMDACEHEMLHTYTSTCGHSRASTHTHTDTHARTQWEKHTRTHSDPCRAATHKLMHAHTHTPPNGGAEGVDDG